MKVQGAGEAAEAAGAAPTGVGAVLADDPAALAGVAFPWFAALRLAAAGPQSASRNTLMSASARRRRNARDERSI